MVTASTSNFPKYQWLSQTRFGFIVQIFLLSSYFL